MSRCIKCGGQNTYSPSDVHFDNQVNCPDCKFSWEPPSFSQYDVRNIKQLCYAYQDRIAALEAIVDTLPKYADNGQPIVELAEVWCSRQHENSAVYRGHMIGVELGDDNHRTIVLSSDSGDAYLASESECYPTEQAAADAAAAGEDERKENRTTSGIADDRFAELDNDFVNNLNEPCNTDLMEYASELRRRLHSTKAEKQAYLDDVGRLIVFIADLREIVEDRPGTLMRDELLEYIGSIVEERDKLRGFAAKRAHLYAAIAAIEDDKL